MRALALAALLLVVAPVRAAERWHTVAEGESASSIAERYYGSFDPTDLLLAYNGRSGPDLRPGERLVIPYVTDHRVAAGDNGSTLARRYLGRASAWETIARLNGMIAEAPLRPGRTIRLPVVLRHTLRRGETLSVLAERYYGDSGRGSLLREFNTIEDPRDLAVGSVVEVPLTGLRLASTASAAPPAPEPDPPEPATPTWFAPQYDSARRAYVDGDYEAARQRLAGLIGKLSELPSDEDRSSVWRLAAFVEVAFDRTPQACESFARMQSADADATLDAHDVSPKIRRVLEGCVLP